MARKRVTEEERRQINRVREFKKARNRKPGPDDEGKGDDLLCAICDEGGDLVCCDGVCQRNFHMNETKCRLILGLAEEQAKDIIDNKDYICKNCKYKQHQCFACGKLGSSDLSSKAEVFKCGYSDCAWFYHPKCVAELLCLETETEALLRQGFRCPLHECSACKGGENKDDKNRQFAVCRRCPTAYHRKCLPSDISMEDGPNGQMQRAWDTLTKKTGGTIRLNPIMIYCTKHEIIKKLGTPKMNHIIFPKTVREPKVLVGPTTEDDTSEEEEMPDHPSPEQSQPPANEADTSEKEEVPQQPSPEPSQPPPDARCSCTHDSFAPSSSFPHPHPGSGGWLGD